MSIATTIVAVLLSFAILFAAAILIVPNKFAFDMITGDQVRNLILGINGIYFFSVALGLGIVTVLVTHRIAGPAWVLKTAVEGFLEGDYSRRTKIRKKDYLKDLSVSMGRLAEHLADQSQRHEEFLAELEKALDRGELEQARALLRDHTSACETPDTPELQEA